MWALGPLHQSPCLWPVVHLASGVITCVAPPPSAGQNLGAASRGVQSVAPAGAPIIAAHCRLVDEDPSSLAPSFDNGASAAPLVFENVNKMFGWSGVRATAASASDSRQSSAATAAQQKPVRYGDLVMIRHDAVVGSAVANGSASPGADVAAVAASVQEEQDDEAEDVSVARTQPLYLVSHRDGRMDWVQVSQGYHKRPFPTPFPAPPHPTSPPVAHIRREKLPWPSH